MASKQSIIEKISRPLPRIADVLLHAFGHNLVDGFSAFLFAATGPGAMTLAIGTAAKLPFDQIAVWMFAGYSLSGVLTVFVCYLYRQPFAFGYSMPALVIVVRRCCNFLLPRWSAPIWSPAC